MIRLPRSTGLAALLALSWITPTIAQDPPKPQPKAEGPANSQGLYRPPQGVVKLTRPAVDPAVAFDVEIKPSPPVAIPDDPPPHEGAFFDLPLTIEPPDIILVEVLESLPGRPITGERLIRPDGTISLGFYGDVHVRGLTLKQAKEKIVLHLRQYMIDEALGLLIYAGPAPGGEEMDNLPPGLERNPFEVDPKMENKPDPVPDEVPPAGKKPEPEAEPVDKPEGRPSARISRRGPPARRILRLVRPGARQEPPKAEPPKEEPQYKKPEVPATKPDREMVVEVEVEPVPMMAIAPADSQRIFVDISSHNTKNYYVQGDVSVPGRLPFTGKDTVLDALNYAGGLAGSAEPTDIHLYRPAGGGKPAKDYKIDYEAIRRGVATANLQLFPNDRLVVGRNPVVAKTAELDRALSPMNAMLNAMLQYSFTARSMAVMNNPTANAASNSGGIKVRLNGQDVVEGSAPPTAMTQAEREALFKEWTEFFWSISSKEGGAMVDEKVFREALMRKLTPAPAPK